MKIESSEQVRTLAEVMEIIQVCDHRDESHPEFDCTADLSWISVMLDYLDGATPEQQAQTWYPDQVPENYQPRPLQRPSILLELEKFVEHAWRFRTSSEEWTRDYGGRQLEDDLVKIDAYLWLLKDVEAIRERRSRVSVSGLLWICERYGFPIHSCPSWINLIEKRISSI